MDTRFKAGDVIVFLKDIVAGYERDNILLIPAYQPCKVVRVNSAHITVDFKGVKEKLRYIHTRMAPAGDMARAIYGEV